MRRYSYILAADLRFTHGELHGPGRALAAWIRRCHVVGIAGQCPAGDLCQDGRAARSACSSVSTTIMVAPSPRIIPSHVLQKGRQAVAGSSLRVDMAPSRLNETIITGVWKESVRLRSSR